MSKKLWTLISLLLIAAMVLAACSPAAETPAATEETPAKTEEPTASEGPTGEVTLWHAYQTGSAEETTLAELVENAKKAYPELTINVLQIPFSEIFNKYQTEVAAGGGPDMFVAPNDDLGNWARGELVAALDEKLAGKLDAFSSVAVDGMKVDGKIYGVPESAKAVALYYNKELLPTPPTTTDDLLKLVEDGHVLVNVQGAYHLFGWSGAFGGKLLNSDNVAVANQGGWAEFMQYLLDLKAAGAIFEPDYGKAEGLFRQGQASMFVNGPWALADYKKDLGDKLGVAPMPAGPGGPATPLNGIDGFYINPNSENQDGAVALALFLTSQESSAIYTAKAGHVPIRSDVVAEDELVAAFAKASATGLPRPQSKEFSNYWGPFGDMFTKVLEGAVDPITGVNEATDAMNAANGKESLPPAAEAEPINITIWHQWDGKYLETITEIFAAYMEMHPNVTIDLTKPDNVSDALKVAIPAGEGPDIIGWANDQIGAQALVGNIVALDELGVTMEYLEATYEPAAVKGVVWQEQIWALPESQEGIALVYNKANASETDFPTDPSDFADLLAKAQAYNEATGKYLICNQGLGNGDAYHVAAVYFGFGMPGYVDDMGNVNLNTPEGIAAAQWIKDFSAVAPKETNHEFCKTSVVEGTAAAWWTGPWAIADLEAAGVDYGILPMGSPFVGIKSLMISQNAVDRGTAEVALDILKFFTNTANSKKLAMANKTIPANTAALADAEVQALATVIGFGKSLNNGYPMANTPFANAQWGPVGDATNAIWNGSQTPEEAMAAAQKAIEDAVAQMK